jgi:ribonucleoside-diphosphate reductase alpha chain
MLALSENSLTVLRKRYLKRDENGNVTETPEEMFRRVASVIAGVEKLYGTSPAEITRLEGDFYAAMTELRFMPNSPTLMNAGRELGQLSACFVLPIEDTMDGIFETVKQTALIHKTGGGTGFSFSRLRPANDLVRTTKGVSSGPISFMEVFNVATETIKQGGTRRGANMAILRVDHPDILDFIMCKKDNDRLNNFNISVAITDEFMEAVLANRDYPVISPRTGETERVLSARKVFSLIVNMAWRNGEPGIVFIDAINRDNPTPALGKIESTNPCGEQPLLPYESCNLGSVNLALFVKEGINGADVDWDGLRDTIHLAVRFLDDVIDANNFPLEKIAEMTRGNRKIGLGVMGWADMLVQLGIPYNSTEALDKAEEVMGFIQSESYAQSVALAEVRGSFPNFERSVHADRYPRLRNAALTTIAPTGTISVIADCSSGIEPYFALAFERHVLDGARLVEVNRFFTDIARRGEFWSEELAEELKDKGGVKEFAQVPPEVKALFPVAHDIAPEWHVRMQSAFQHHIDNAVSKTINFPNSATAQDVEEAYLLAWREGCKGITVYRDGSRDLQVLNIGDKEKNEGIAIPGKIKPRPRPDMVHGITPKVKTACGNLYITLNEDDIGLCEIFAQLGKSGDCVRAFLEWGCRLASMALRAGVGPAPIVENSLGIMCPKPCWVNGEQVLSCPDAIGRMIQENMHIELFRDEPEVGTGELCPDCGMKLEQESGCAVCRSCGFSRCS